MEAKINENAVNQYPGGSIIFTGGDSVYSIGMIIKGRVLIQNDGYKIMAGSGAFLGINDLYLGKYQSTYTAVDDVLIFIYPIDRTEELDAILSINKDHHGFMVASFYKMIFDLDQIYRGMVKCSSTLHQFLREYYEKYKNLAVRRGCAAKNSLRIEKLELIDNELELISDRIQYYNECRNLPVNVVKKFYSYGNAISLYQIEDEVNVVNQQIGALQEMVGTFTALAQCLVDDGEDCLFRMIAELSLTTDSTTGISDEIMDMMDDIIEQVNQAETFSNRMLGQSFKVDRKKMEEVYHLLLTNNKGNVINAETLIKYSIEETQRVEEETKNSFAKIIEYSGVEEKIAGEMKTAMDDFVHLKDRLSSDDNTRQLRRKLSENHYVLYLSVFLKAYEDKNPPKIVDLFLKYGYADERLLDREQMLSLYFMKEEEVKPKLCHIYNIKEWLTEIYKGKKEPSRNEFDMGYAETIMSFRKQNKLTEEAAAQWIEDPRRRLEYEIQNMFRYNNRITNGQITSFVPVLCKEQWNGGIEKLYVTTVKVEEAIDRLIKIDYSIFDREVIYTDKEKNIRREYIIKRVFPDIILLPTVGINGIMWQEVTGKRRDSAGRFLLPVFTESELADLLIRVFGKFRWEMCRTIEGIAWNDIKRKSLTSEYSDYLQFYRRNKELSEEKKEKLKQQILRGRNSSREIFVIDYEIWIHYEVNGAIKLNKPVREMMATYCPFSKELRERLKLQPLFEEAMTRYYKEKQKKIREIERNYRILEKENIELPQELIDTLDYYRNK